jgi:hypothetical protein
LRSADGQRQRNCKVRGDRHEMQVNETGDPVKVAYSRLSIVDSDDWPDGDYVVEFSGQEELLTRKDGSYYARRA